ncbi:MAG: hypothetical protein M0R49_09310 [Limnochordia bacterium]|nr:hypothetical protein [Limnochordia bacterium]
MNTISTLVFGFDIDGVLTNDDDGDCSIWIKEASHFFGLPIPEKRSYYIEDAFNKSKEEVRAFFQARIEHIFRAVPIRDHAVQTLQDLRDQKHTIHLITARDERHRSVTEEWLNRQGVPYDSLFMSPPQESYSKGTLCQELGVGFFVDDKVENALETAKNGVYTLLFHASHNLGQETSLPLVKDWAEVREHIARYLGNNPF